MPSLLPPNFPLKGLFVLVLIIVLPLLAIATRQEQDTKQEAKTIKRGVACNKVASILTSFAVVEQCDGVNFRYAFYTCSDGSSAKLGTPTSCVSADIWQQDAEEKCSEKRVCEKERSSFPTTPSPNFSLVCDLDINGQVNSNDFTQLNECMKNQSACNLPDQSRVDMNSDGIIDVIDLNYFFKNCKFN